MHVSVETSIARHIGDRKEQQDRVVIMQKPSIPGLLLAVLADGMGGLSGGAVAAEAVIRSARQTLDVFTPATEQPEQFLENVVRAAHAGIRQTRSNEHGPHATIVVFLLFRGKAYWAHCGDSRLYHFHGGVLASRTQDHSLVGELQRRGRLTEEEALVHPQKNVLIACLGSDLPPRVDQGQYAEVGLDDQFLLCSDGLWRYFNAQELATAVSEKSANDGAQFLLDGARERANGTGDNLSLAIVKLGRV